MLRPLILFTIIFLFAGRAAAQTDTIINHYAAVLNYDPCTNEFIVDTASAFAPGDDILLIQMKGIEADTSNTITFGQVQHWRHTGNYEINKIRSISGNTIHLSYTLARQYDIPTGRVQVVRIPRYNTYTVNNTHTSAAWTGSKGGIFAIWATDSLVLHAGIDVSHKGFRGGLNDSNTPHNKSMLNQPDYHYQVNPHKGAAKGEGVMDVLPSSAYCRGPLYNGGGGGNSINSGGGGGSNAGAGGRGGNEWEGALPPDNVYGGLGGYPFAYTPADNRIFLGGGGGAGEANDGFITRGGNGGGIILILTGKLLGNNHPLRADGEQGIDCPGTYCNDGFGGGGAGGTIIINAQHTDQLNCSAQGGRGANLVMNAGHGPGGGGSGGAILFNTAPASATYNYHCTGGVAGQFINGTAISNWGAQHGDAGITADGFIIPVAAAPFLPFSATIKDSILDCKRVQLTAINNGRQSSFLWLYDQNKTSQSNPTILTFGQPGKYNVKLVLADTIGCTDTLYHTFDLDSYSVPLTTSNDTAICSGDKISLWVHGAQSYVWTPATGLNDISSSAPLVTLANTATYYVHGIDASGCTGSDSVIVSVHRPPHITITASQDELTCDRLSMQLFAAGAVSYQWSPAEVFNNPSISDPVVAPGLRAVTVAVKGTDANGCTTTASYDIPFTQTVKVFVPDAFTPNGDLVNDHIRSYPVCNFNFISFSIYNRWGQRVFYSHDVEEGWDGRFNRLPEQVGVYYYYIKGKKNNGENAMIRGDITLIR